jgi:hypothetical protein
MSITYAEASRSKDTLDRTSFTGKRCAGKGAEISMSGPRWTIRSTDRPIGIDKTTRLVAILTERPVNASALARFGNEEEGRRLWIRSF